MIKSVDLSNIAHFAEHAQINSLTRVNYCYGPNGSGKTTIGKVIKEGGVRVECSDTEMPEKYIFNRDYVDSIFGEDEKVPGVFTLGEDNKQIQEHIKEIAGQIDEKTRKLNSIQIQLEGDPDSGTKSIDDQIKDLKISVYDSIWDTRVKSLLPATQGYNNSKEAFGEHLLGVKDPNTEAQEIEKLSEDVKVIFSQSLSKVELLSEISLVRVGLQSQYSVLLEKVAVDSDSGLASLIEQLGNIDWVRSGVEYLDKSDGDCPFCQQGIAADIVVSLQAMVRGKALEVKKVIEDEQASYRDKSQALLNSVQKLQECSPDFIDSKNIEMCQVSLEKKLEKNFFIFEQKKKKLGESLELDSLENEINTLNKLIKGANEKISTNNAIADNQQNAKNELSGEVWSFYISNNSSVIKKYRRELSELNGKATGLTSRSLSLRDEIAAANEDLRNSQKRISGIVSVLEAINGFLDLYGFTSFRLSQEGDDSYQLIRDDGESVSGTLSEGERNFLCFLYFYYSLQGSKDRGIVSSSKIVVIDDPVSSLDSESLFMISALVKAIIDDASEDNSSIKQVFILTHNVYFFKEIVFSPKRSGSDPFKEETFWVIRKFKTGSEIERKFKIPIISTYELLWEEIKEEKTNYYALQNSMRRILENFSRLIGIGNFKNVDQKFEGAEKIVCHSLCAWVNDGSHNTFGDEFYMPISDEDAQRYLDVFRRVFEAIGQREHYEIMMGKG